MQISQSAYFERQGCGSLLCGMHALNNLMGQGEFKKEDLDEISSSLSSNLINPHRSLFGGDYDINVLQIALQRRNIELSWHDSRKKVILEKEVIGFLINLHGQSCCLFSMFNCLFSGNHWIVCKKYQEGYLELDSKKQKPLMLNQKDLVVRLQSLRQQGHHILFLYQKAKKEIVLV